ncbi:Flp pilus assembly protein TadG [Aeromicrobium panaciterrae]|uniref:Flp pilus assembly protein TadG n=1 Tax=Aeromicrobium panaciterrae TaxID=363861 RepID=A0ABU1ULN7_9ACTN|nr:pilus assembly protein [Aeromicrobium panaciterrae]MDR7086070.1 Flp pilus assembly protein TadG [Aeromicrobium panaciterrae]
MVEFALIVPFLLLLICGVIDFGERYKTSAQYNNAAFVAARSMTIENNTTKAKAAAVSAGMPSSLTPVITFTSGYTSCAQASDGTFGNVTVTITNASKASATKFFGTTYSVTGKAVARCSGT